MMEFFVNYGAFCAFGIFLAVLVTARVLVRRRRVEISDTGMIVDRTFAFGWLDIRKLDFWVERGIARYVVYLGASRYAFNHKEATLNDPLKLKHLIIERAKLEKVPGEGRVESFLRQEDSRKLPGALLQAAAARRSRNPMVLALEGLGAWMSRAKWTVTVVSLVVSTVAYQVLIGSWTTAIGLIGIILIHELGHAWVMRAHGLRAGAPVFIPFVGALIALKDQPRDAMVEAEIGYGGPMAGAIASTGAFVLAYFTRDVQWMMAAVGGFLLNLFNMIPVLPLDGGRIAAAISTRMWVVGVILLGLAYALTWNVSELIPVHILLFVIAAMGMGNAIKAWRDPRRLGPKNYYDVPTSYRISMGLAYFMLSGFLAWMLWTCITGPKMPPA